jgi:hypothetical protein
MTGKNKTPLIGWHPRPDLVAWLKAEVKRRGGKRGVQSDILDEALDVLRARDETTDTTTRGENPQ